MATATMGGLNTVYDPVKDINADKPAVQNYFLTYSGPCFLRRCILPETALKLKVVLKWRIFIQYLQFFCCVTAA